MAQQVTFPVAASNMEQALADTLQSVINLPNVTPEEIERVLKLIIKKEIVLELLLEEFPTTV